ncbi:four and a half LIM domains protein 3-like [Lethenteron reissneri]|uniref:four and a half LIM domains protein 3-like n=1 Tax=Lethenteron reissneri TaxID=7753 RepID=UPI002AB73B06|nr:four and a half LIM domains protein 3-like [Lethenteron reissneri]
MSDRCQHCQTPLAGRSYVMRENRTYCSECFEKLFSHACAACAQSIGPGQRELIVSGKHYHDKCLKCGRCGVPVANKPYDSSGDVPLCSACAGASPAAATGALANQCVGCRKVIHPGTAKIVYEGKTFHDHCFKCSRCHESIGKKGFIPVGEAVYCAPCHKKI